MKTIKVIFEGRVQGVGFRYSTKEIAKGFDLIGTVKNLTDGTVEMIASGETAEIDEFLNEITEVSELAHHITGHAVTEIAALSDLKGFTIVS